MTDEPPSVAARTRRALHRAAVAVARRTAPPVPEPGPAPPRHVSVPLPAGEPPRVRADLDDGVVDLVVTIDADDLEQRPAVVEALAALAEAWGPRVTAVVYEAEEAVGRTHAPPRLPASLPLVEPEVARGWAAGLARTYPALTGARAVVVDSSVEIGLEALWALVDHVRGDVVLAQAVVRRTNETIASAGAFFVPGGAAPGALLAGFPPEDLEAVGAVAVTAADSPVFAVRTRDLVPARATVDQPLSVTSLSLAVSRSAEARTAGAGRVLSVPLGRVHRLREPERRSDPVALELVQSWDGMVDDAAGGLLGRLGLRLEGATVLPTGPVPARVARPVVGRLEPVRVHEAAPRLRWSLKTAAWAGARGDDWGDVFFAHDLATALRGLGQAVVVDNRESSVRPESEHLDDVSLVLRGLDRVPLHPSAVTVLWVISHPDRVSDEELSGYDLRYAAGRAWAERTTARTGLPVGTLLQATAPERFHPGPVDPELASDVLFVGKTREVFRPVVRDAVEAGLDLSVWGEGWSSFIAPETVRGEFLANDRLPAAYRSARVVLNDHWADMAREGFVSNRVFDAVASGALVVSDEVEGLVDVFGDGVRTYRTVDDLRRLGAESRADRAVEARLAAAAVARDHSFAQRASRLLADVLTTARSRSGR
ncbi:glycosyl transferase family 1 [Frigoribacterium sp. PhB160]|nr:glycosyl transferase family 1 [Frigoribacterium sp. PhB160]